MMPLRFLRSLTFFCTRDLDACDRFYGGTLGLRAVLRTGGAILYRVTDTAYFGLTSGPGREPAGGGALLELVVADRAAVDAWHARITTAGHPVDGAPREGRLGGVYCFFASDPNGYLVEILHFADPSILEPAEAGP